MVKFPRRHVLAFGCLLLLGLSPSVAQVAGQERRQFDLAPQDLKYALRAVTRSAGLELSAQTDDLRGRRSPEIHGELTVQQALDRLLAGTGLDAAIEGKSVVVRGRSAAPTGDLAADRPVAQDIVVTGSHIRGAAIASPTVTLSAKSIREQGQTSLGDALRDLPQNFSGGQNPGIVGNGDQGGENLNSSSNIDLRGLGPDATLTLVNGHRVAYTGQTQGVDIDQIPIAALDRIEIVADGASAVYGSDAVGGVANIILKRDYQGATISSRFGATTGGGDEQQQYDLTTGSRWTSGGFMIALDVRRNTDITGDQRSITRRLGHEMTVLPWIHQYGGVLAGHQDLTDRLHLEIDGSYNRRVTANSFPTSDVGVVTQDGSLQRARETTYSVSPRLVFDISDRWHSSVTATYATDRSFGSLKAYSGGNLLILGHYGYLNRTAIAEVSADGPLFGLPGGSAQLALGGGYRTNRLLVTNDASYLGTPETPLRVSGHQPSGYGYAELNLPFLSPRNGVRGIHALSASAAVRYEDYPGQDRLATPRVGLVYEPTQDISLKASWGKSFKTPTLYQQRQLESAVLLPSSYFGTGAPAGSNIVYLSGGNPALKAERATSWSATLDVHPHRFAGFDAEFSYFHIDYRNRVVSPIQSTLNLLDNPIYQDLLDRAPSLAFLEGIPAAAGGGFDNYTGGPYDPTTVYAVVDNRNLNAARELVRGFDLSLRYESKVGADGSIALAGAVSHLSSARTLSDLQPAIAQAGTIFNAPHWRGHASLIWKQGPLTLAGDVTYIGGVTDNRQPVSYRVRGMAPVDLTASYHLGIDHSALKGLDVILAIRNIQDVMPSVIVNDNLFDPTYDSNNYSAIGRSINLTISASF